MINALTFSFNNSQQIDHLLKSSNTICSIAAEVLFHFMLANLFSNNIFSGVVQIIFGTA